MGDKTKSTDSDGGGEGGNIDRREVHTHTTARNSFVSVVDGGCGSTDGPGKQEKENQSETEKTNVARSEKRHSGKTLEESGHPTRKGQHASDTLRARAEIFTPPIVLLRDPNLTKQAEDTLSLVGLKAQDEKELMDVSSSFNPTSLPIIAGEENMESTTTNAAQVLGKKSKAKVQIKKMAREKGKVKKPNAGNITTISGL